MTKKLVNLEVICPLQWQQAVLRENNLLRLHTDPKNLQDKFPPELSYCHAFDTIGDIVIIEIPTIETLSKPYWRCNTPNLQEY